MIFNGFEVRATPYVTDVYCKCGESLQQVFNGLLRIALFCVNCHSVYTLTLRKLPKKKITKEFIDQSLKELVKRKT